MMLSMPAKASTWRRRNGESSSTSRSGGASFSGVQSCCRNSGTTFSPTTRLAKMTDFTLIARSTSDPERRALFLLADHDAWRDLPSLDALIDRFQEMRHSWQDQLKRDTLVAQPAQRLAEDSHVMSDLAAATARQNQKNRRRFVTAFLLAGTRPQRSDLLNQGMTDIAA